MAIVKKYKVEIIDIENHDDSIYSLELKSHEKKFRFYPGQFLHLALDKYDPSLPWPDSRCFSIQTSPGIDTIKITYAVKGKFTTRMAQSLTIGNEIYIKLPFGDLFAQNHNKRNNVFIAGGTGITPFLSLFNDVSFKEYENPKLYFGLRNKKLNFYKKELNEASNINSGFNISIICEDIDGQLDIGKIHSENLNDSTYFISGPPVMIKNFKNYLLENGLAENQVLTDDWE